VRRLGRLREIKRREQVAAVCYRLCDDGVQFLLVQARSGRWTFPKGGVEPGLSHAQVAALEAYEEAGVHGRMEEIAFARYVRRKREKSRKPAIEISVNAHLCQVLRLGRPQETGRNRTWFSGEKAKRWLREGRPEEDGTEFARVIDRAIARVRRLHAAAGGPLKKDALQRVQFEGGPVGRGQGQMEASFVRYVRRAGAQDWTAIEFALNAYLGKVLGLGPRKKFPADPKWISPPKADPRGPGRAQDLKQKLLPPVEGSVVSARPENGSVKALPLHANLIQKVQCIDKASGGRSKPLGARTNQRP
jgi:8-oxo-dGTP pyrophosphatase MutT (NUDIX family)